MKPEEEQPTESRGRVLLMDDDEDILFCFQEALPMTGYAVETATKGEEAIDLYKKRAKSSDHFDVVILDLTVKTGMGGLETLEELLKIDPAVKAILFSGYSCNGEVEKYKDYGFCAVLHKPITIEDLSSTLNSVLSLNK